MPPPEVAAEEMDSPVPWKVRAVKKSNSKAPVLPEDMARIGAGDNDGGCLDIGETAGGAGVKLIGRVDGKCVGGLQKDSAGAGSL